MSRFEVALSEYLPSSVLAVTETSIEEPASADFVSEAMFTFSVSPASSMTLFLSGTPPVADIMNVSSTVPVFFTVTSNSAVSEWQTLSSAGVIITATPLHSSASSVPVAVFVSVTSPAELTSISKGLLPLAGASAVMPTVADSPGDSVSSSFSRVIQSGPKSV